MSSKAFNLTNPIGELLYCLICICECVKMKFLISITFASLFCECSVHALMSPIHSCCFCQPWQPDSFYLSVFCFPLVCPHVHLSLTLVLFRKIFFMHIEKHLMFSCSLYVVLFLFSLFRIGFRLICKVKFKNIPFFICWNSLTLKSWLSHQAVVVTNTTHRVRPSVLLCSTLFIHLFVIW